MADGRKIVYRVGVHLGDVLIEGEDILGEGVNIAARLEGICEPGGVLISGSVYEHVRGRVETSFVDLSTETLKTSLSLCEPIVWASTALRQQIELRRQSLGSRPLPATGLRSRSCPFRT